MRFTHIKRGGSTVELVLKLMHQDMMHFFEKADTQISGTGVRLVPGTDPRADCDHRQGYH